MIRYEQARPEHAQLIASRMREHDKMEFGLFNVASAKAIADCVEKSKYSRAAFVDDQIACMWGVLEHGLITGANLWLVTTPLVEQHRIKFLKENRKFIQSLKSAFPFSYVFVDEAYTKSRRWIEWLGFTQTDTTAFRDITLVRYELRGD
jgi:hypothetical protein